MIIPLVHSIAVVAPLPDIAYVARYYYPYPDHRISNYQVYVSDIYGRSRRQISKNRSKSICDLQWTSNSRIEWREEESNSHTTTRYEFDLATNQLRRISQNTEQGTSFVEFMWEGLSRADSIEHPVPYEHCWIGQTNRFYLKGSPDIREIYSYQEKDGKESINHLYFERSGKWAHFSDDEIFSMQFYRSNLRNHDWFVTSGMATTAGRNASLFLVDWNAENAKLIASDCTSYSLSSDEKIWTGHEGGRPLSTWGPEKKIWTGKLFAGDMKGRRWEVTSGPVLCLDSAMRPGMTASR